MNMRDKNSKQSVNDADNIADPNSSTDSQRQSRRRLIQTLALGGGIATSKLVPNNWIAPAVQTAVLPAHAAGSECTLGNSFPEPIEVTEAAGPGPVLEFAEQVADALLAEAEAGGETDDEPTDARLLLTGCYWITFFCNSNEGTLYATASTGEGDFDSGDTILQAPFTSGVEGDIDGYCFIVTLQNGGSSATLRINNGSCGVADEADPIQLNDPSPNCQPCDVDIKDGPIIVC